MINSKFDSKISKGLDEALSPINLLILGLSIVGEMLFSTFSLMSLFLLYWEIDECIKPPSRPEPITTPAFCKGGREVLAIVLPTAPAIPVIVAPKPIWVPIVILVL